MVTTSMKRLRFPGAIAFVLFGIVVAAGQRAPDQPDSAQALQRPREPMHITRAPEPVVPVSSDTDLGDTTFALDASFWTPLGPAPIVNGQRPGSGPVTGRVTGIAAHPTDPMIIYLTAAGGGVWKTTNGGTTWSALNDGAVQSMGAIAIAPSNPNVVYAGQGESNNTSDSNYGRGMLISNNGGSSWATSTADGAFDRRAFSEIAVDPTDSTVAYAAVADFAVNGLTGNTGVWKTTNGGTTWTNTTSAITQFDPWSSVRVDPNNSSIVYAAVGNFAGSAQNGVYKTVNGGTNWSLLNNAPNGMTVGRIVVAVSKSNSQVVYVSAASSSTFGLNSLKRSDNGGTTFTDLTPGTPNYLGAQGYYGTTLTVDPSNPAVVYAGGGAGANSLIRSTNAGVDWTDITQGAAAPFDGPNVYHHAAAFDGSGRYLDGDDGGIYLLDTPSPTHWRHLNGNLNTIQLQGVALHPTDANIAFGGSQNGTSKYTGSLGWSLVEGGDGGSIKFSRTDPSRLYRDSSINSFGATAFFRRSDNGGTTWTSKVSGITDNTSTLQNFYPPFVVDPNDGNRVLFGARHVWETTNGGDSWTALGAAFAANATAIGLAPSDADTIYAATGVSTFVTTNRGGTWTPRNLPVSGTVRDIQVSTTDALTAYAVIGVFTSAPSGYVFKTTNGGVAWTNITGNLSSIPAWSLQIDSTTPGRLFVGNDDGVYVTNDDGTTWARLGTGLPSVQTFQIELNSSLRILGAGTHGRGLWEIHVMAAPTVVTQPATGVGITTAILNGTANPNGVSTTAQFQYGLTAGYGTTTPPQNLGSVSTDVAIGGGGLAPLTCNKVYHFRAVATNSIGTTNGADAMFTTAPCIFTDDPITAGVTGIRAVHITELRNRIDALRVRFALSSFAWTDGSLVSGSTIVRAVHLIELRIALQQAYQAAAQAAPTYTDPTLVPNSTLIKAVHVRELRTAVAALEAT